METTSLSPYTTGETQMTPKLRNFKKAQSELNNAYFKQQTEYIQDQINKIRDSVDDRQSRIAWQTVNEVSRRKSTARAKLKAARLEEQKHLWKQHFKNLLGEFPKVTDELIRKYPQKYGKQGNSSTYYSDTETPYIIRTLSTDEQRATYSLSSRELTSK